MYRTLAVAAVLVGLSVGSVTYGADNYALGGSDTWATPNRFDRGEREDTSRLLGNRWIKIPGYDSPGDDTLYDSPGDDTLYDSPGDDTFFDVFMEKRLIDDGDPGFRTTEALWLELLGW